MRSTQYRVVAAVAAVSVAITACGSDDTTSDVTTETEHSVATIEPELDPSVVHGGTTTVTVGDDEFLFSQQVQCLTTDGYLAGSFFSDDGAVTFDDYLPPEDWESRPDEDWSAPSVWLDGYRGGSDLLISWRAGDEFMDGLANVPPDVQVTSFQVDGETASGTATVVRYHSFATGMTETAEMTLRAATSTMDDTEAPREGDHVNRSGRASVAGDRSCV